MTSNISSVRTPSPAGNHSPSSDKLKRKNALSAHAIKKKLEWECVREYFEGCKKAYLEARLPRGTKL